MTTKAKEFAAFVRRFLAAFVAGLNKATADEAKKDQQDADKKGKGT